MKQTPLCNVCGQPIAQTQWPRKFGPRCPKHEGVEMPAEFWTNKNTTKK